MFDKTNRVGIIVHLYYNRDAKKIMKYGDFVYHSRRMRYLVLYVNQEEVDSVLHKLKELKFVKEAYPSYFEDIDFNFVGNLWEK
ncbi:DUF2129 domain-containing protein [Streptococcus sp. CSL10205-OR2]|uniref:DUF2129 domain-containing protein n=1 Tax=Streptococcus sp. CSL10205-OR2 TaxID=2980558 RepID=UPI0021D8E9BF|nr:DUF2129 domain-containing protein [Streptococcus sp. CSL10205-OR2]MCU9534287.1 DUF2129 domain-containing protein [Streptococcus sp. CSL10205-OR2]